LRSAISGVDWIDVSQDRVSWPAVVNFILNHWVTQAAGHFLASWADITFWRTALLSGVT